MAAAPRKISVVVPTYNETENLAPLTKRLFAATRSAGLEADLLFADDESPGTEASASIVDALREQGYAVRMHRRRRDEGRGLSSAVLLGFSVASHDVLVCMDADLQHEPEAVPAIARPVLDDAADFAIGSRNVGDGGIGFDWSVTRRVVSWGATLLAAPLTCSTDPMSGFFCVRRETLDRGKRLCNPRGFKIALEIMVRCRCRRVRDVPITFRERVAGESKLTMTQNVEYVRQLLALYWFVYKMYLAAALAAGLAVVVVLVIVAGQSR